MANSRSGRRIADPGLQPERTALAWLRTLFGYGALMVLALRQKGPEAGALLWSALIGLTLVLLVLWGYARRRNLMDVAIGDFASSGSVRAKLVIAISVVMLALVFAISHLRAIFGALF